MSEERKLNFNPKAALEKTQKDVEIHTLEERVRELEGAFEGSKRRVQEVYDPLLSVLDQMKDVNVNIHPLKMHILQHWRDQVENILNDLTAQPVAESIQE